MTSQSNTRVGAPDECSSGRWKSWTPPRGVSRLRFRRRYDGGNRQLRRDGMREKRAVLQLQAFALNIILTG